MKPLAMCSHKLVQCHEVLPISKWLSKNVALQNGLRPQTMNEAERNGWRMGVGTLGGPGPRALRGEIGSARLRRKARGAPLTGRLTWAPDVRRARRRPRGRASAALRVAGARPSGGEAAWQGPARHWARGRERSEAGSPRPSQTESDRHQS